MKTSTVYLFAVILTAISYPLQAGSLSVPNTFSAGSAAVAAEVNGNFGAVKTSVDDNDSRITALEAIVSAQAATITSLQATLAGKANTSHTHSQAEVTGLGGELSTHASQISAINNSEIMALSPYVTIANDSRGPIATFSGLNLKLVNGTGTTEGASNGLGNLIIGYDLPYNIAYSCSYGLYPLQADCESNGYIWAASHKTGSHYLVIGDRNNYSRFGGMVVGKYNRASNDYASVGGGYSNTASGSFSSASGRDNIASGSYTSVSGGAGNIASGNYATVSGGVDNTASGTGSSASGGYTNTSSGFYTSVLGGNTKTISGGYETSPATP